jgi:hypothetical protein
VGSSWELRCRCAATGAHPISRLPNGAVARRHISGNAIIASADAPGAMLDRIDGLLDVA